MVNATRPISNVRITGTGNGVCGMAGTLLLGRIAERLDITAGLSQVMAGTTQRSSAHDRGTVLTHLSMMVAAGGRCVSDLATLRNQPRLFGTVASDPTAWRTLNVDVDDDRLDGIAGVRQAATRLLLAETDLDERDTVTLDIDATLLHLHSEDKQQAGKTFKGGWGFHPMMCFIEPFGLPAGTLRGGGATANNAADQLAVVDQAIASLPAVWRAGHQPGDDPDDVQRQIVVRTDTAGGTKKMTDGLAARNVVFSVGMRAYDAAVGLIADIDDDDWTPAIQTNGHVRPYAWVAEVHDLPPDWAPKGTRAIVRKERRHPGARMRLWDSDGYRYQVTLTNDPDRTAVDIELDHRRHAQVENRIKQLKDTGLSRLPFSSWTGNRGWFEIVMLAALLLAALRTYVDHDDLSAAEPRRLRYTLLAVAAKLAHHARQLWVHLDRTWPWTDVLVRLHHRLDVPPATIAC